MIEPMPSGMNQIMFIRGTWDSSSTIIGVNMWPKKNPIVLLKLNKIVAKVRCCSLNQCWLILVGMQEMKGVAAPVNA